MSRRSVLVYLLGIGLLFASAVAWYASAFLTRPSLTFGKFDGQRALQDIEIQVAFGPRVTGSDEHSNALAWIRKELELAGWSTRIQKSEMLGHPIQNLIAYRHNEPPSIILAAHYDTRMIADNDPDPVNRTKPVPGANDGASGVAVLLELARNLPEDSIPVWLVFFDAEDNGNIPGWDWILGSQSFASQMDFSPEAVVVVDMVGDSDQNIYIERNSNQGLVDELWTVAESLGYIDRFIPEAKYSMTDDHTPFLQKGIPAVDIIDFDYAYWHTISDTPDKVSAESLQAVGETLGTWIGKRSTE
jgi:glutaminyl-peptide cyclotransferase